MEWAPLRSPPLWRAHDMFESLDVSLRVEGKSSPDGVLFCRLDPPGNLPRIERSAVGNGFNLHRGPILNSISFGVYALRSECRDVVNGANAAGDPDRRPGLLSEFNVQGARHSMSSPWCNGRMSAEVHLDLRRKVSYPPSFLDRGREHGLRIANFGSCHLHGAGVGKRLAKDNARGVSAIWPVGEGCDVMDDHFALT